MDRKICLIKIGLYFYLIHFFYRLISDFMKKVASIWIGVRFKDNYIYLNTLKIIFIYNLKKDIIKKIKIPLLLPIKSKFLIKEINYSILFNTLAI